MKRYKLILVPFLIVGYSLTAQNIAPGSYGYYVEALSDSRTTQTGGTARVMGLAGAQTALGADLGALTSNPAGLGVFRKSEVSGSLGFNLASTSSTLFGNTVAELKPNMNINNLGAAFCSLRDDIVESKWRGGTFAIAMNTLQSYQNRYSYEGVNQNNSFINSLEQQAYDKKIQPSVYDNEYSNNNVSSLTSLGYSSYLINYDKINSTILQPSYYGFVPPDKVMDQKSTVSTSGAIRSWSLGYGGNYNDKFFFGASLGILSLSRTTQQTYTETLLNGGSAPYLQNFTFTDKMQVHGTGVNLTLGAIYKFNDIIRIGGSIKTPDYYGIKEQHNASIVANYNDVILHNSDGSVYNLNNASANLTTTKFNYQLYSPLKANLGMSLFMGKHGFFTFDWQYVNYKGMFLSSNNNSYLTADNTTIKNVYHDVVNIRSGVEIRADIVRIRGGIAYLPSPYLTGVDERIMRVVSGATYTYNLGFGVKLSNVSIDLAYSLTKYSSNYSPYALYSGTQAGQQPLVKTNNNLNTVVVTVSGNF